MTSLESSGARALRMGARTRKTVLIVHISSAGIWLGMDVVMGVIVATAILTEDAGTKALSFRALELFAIWPLFTAGVVCLISGIVLGLGTKYGLVRYWWVAVKLTLNVVLVALVLFALRPGVIEAAELGRRYAADGLSSLPVGNLAFPPIVSTSALIFAMVLAVFKPWGRIRARRDRSR